jgi:hypothetical protein
MNMTDKQRESRVIIEKSNGETVTYAANSLEDAMAIENHPTITAKKSKSVGELTVKVNVDISEALAGLKALQREAKEAVRALRELEQWRN